MRKGQKDLSINIRLTHAVIEGRIVTDNEHRRCLLGQSVNVLRKTFEPVVDTIIVENTDRRKPLSASHQPCNLAQSGKALQ